MKLKYSRRGINTSMIVLMFMLGLYNTVYQLLATTIQDTINLSDALFGALSAIHFGGAMVFTVVLGEISDRVGRKKAILLGLLIFVIGTIFVTISSNQILVLCSFFLIGAGLGVCESLLQTIVAEENPTQSSKYVNLVNAAYSIGAIISPILASRVLMPLVGLHGVYAIITVVLVLIGIRIAVIDFGGKKESAEKYTSQGIVTFQLLKEKFFLLMCIIMFIYLGMENIVGFWLNSYFTSLNIEGVSDIALSVFWVGMLASRLYATFIMTDKTRKTTYLVLLGVTAVSILCACLIPSVVAKIIFMGLAGIGLGPQWAIIVTYVTEKYADISGSAVGALMTWTYFGGVVIPLVTGFITAASASVVAYTIVVILAVCAALLFVMSMKHFKKAE